MVEAIKKTSGILVQVGSFLTAFFLVIAGVLNTLPADTAEAALIKNDPYVLFDALALGQGITNDGEYFYTSGCAAPLKWGLLMKIDMTTDEIVAKNNFAIPMELINKGCDHIGDISYYNGYIYAAIEGKPYINNYIALYDAETLEYTGISYELEQENHIDGVPWVAVDAERGYAYTAEWNHATRLNVYELDTMKFSHYLDINGGDFHRIQGAEVFDGILYASSDDASDKKNVYALDLDTGELSLAFTRNISRAENEAEGMTVSRGEDGKPIFHVLDYDKIFSSFIRHYTLKD